MINNLTAIRNLPSINATFETGFGEALWFFLTWFATFMLFAVQVLSVGVLIYTIVLIFISWQEPKRDYQMHKPKKKFLVFIPAHNEETVVAHIVENLLYKMRYPQELLKIYVIADNSTDNTAAIARNAGADVIEHFSGPDEPKGKPYGIKYALDYIGDDLKNYDAIAIFDADNLISLDFFNEMNSQMLSDPKIMVSQGYLDAKNVDGSIVSLGYSLSYYLSNRFFVYARNKLNLSPVIGGTGFVMDRRVIEDIGWTVNSLTEDLELQMQCALYGYRVVWNHFAPIYDEKPIGYKQSMVQRTRWARGHWTVNRRYFVPLVTKIIKQYLREGKFDTIALDSAFYSISPLAIASSPIVLFVSLFTAGPQKILGMVLIFFISVALSITLSRYAMRHDSKQRTNSSVWKMFAGLVWYMGSAMLVYLYGILTYKQNIWVRTEHKATTAIQDILAVSED